MVRRSSCLLALIWLLTFAGCASGRSESLPVFEVGHASDLLLPDEVFPPTWEANPCTGGCDRAEGAWFALRSFGRANTTGSVTQRVYGFEQTTDAHQRFGELRDAEFAPLPLPKQSFVPRPDVQYNSTLADEVTTGCGADIISVCKALLRYRNYVILIYFDMDMGTNDGLQFTDIAPILHNMDLHVAQVVHVQRAVPSELKRD